MEGLRLKSLNEIMQGMTGWVTARTNKITDFNVGSVVRTLFESIALQLEEVYYSMWKNFLWAVENSVFNSFGFSRKVETKATTYITTLFKHALEFSYTIPKGTKFSKYGGDLYYQSTAPVVVSVGSIQAIVPVECIKGGSIGNCLAYEIDTMVTFNSLVQQVYNAEDIVDGRDAETKPERKERFIKYLRSLARGTEDAIMYGALEVDGVTGAWPDCSEIGLVKLYIHGPSGSQLSDSKITEVKENIVNYRSAGVEVLILPVVPVAINLSVTITIREGYDVSTYKELVTKATENYFKAFTVSKNFHISEIVKYYMNLDTTAILFVTITEPTQDLFVEGYNLVTLDKLFINVETYVR